MKLRWKQAVRRSGRTTGRLGVWLLASITLLALAIAACADGEEGGDAGGLVSTAPMPTPTRPLDRPGTVGCEDGTPDSPAASPENLFFTPGFEEGRDPWFSKDSWGTSFSLSDREAHSGERSALLELRSDVEGAISVRVYGVVQEIAPEQFPEVISGYYCVDRWEQGTPTQYLQFVVIVHDAENIPPEVASATNHQIRYILAGVQSQPGFISNARYVMVTQDEPVTGKWVSFERNIRDDFEELWGGVPRGYQKLALFFEVRWDDRQPSDGLSAADVYYDDLYIGPERGNAD